MKAAIFDLDGTLVESLPGISEALNQTLSDYHCSNITESIVRTYIGDGQWMLLRRAFPLQHFSDHDISNIETTFTKYYTQTWLQGTVIYDGILTLLEHLKSHDVHLGVLSNKKHSFTTEIVESLFGRELIPLIYGQKDHIPKKPNANALLSISSEIHVSPAEITYIGDSTIDLETAMNANTNGVGVTWGYHYRDQLEKFQFPLCDTVKELNLVLSSS